MDGYTFKFGKYKGKTAEEVCSTKEGRAYVEWLIGQPTSGEFADANKKRNEYLKKVLSQAVATKKQAVAEKIIAPVVSWGDEEEQPSKDPFVKSAREDIIDQIKELLEKLR